MRTNLTEFSVVPFYNRKILTSGHLERDLCTGQQKHDRGYYHSFFRTGVRALWTYRANDHVADHQHESPGKDYWSSTQNIQQKNSGQRQDDTDGLTDCLVHEELVPKTDLSVESWAVYVAKSSQKEGQMTGQL
jgi:hypothetical protein